MTTSVVTGGAGFLGSHLCDFLIDKGHRVICVDNLETGSLENIEHLRDPAFSFVYQDVVDGIWIDEPVDFVYHLASPASPIDYLRLPLQTLKVGSQGTHNALGLAKWKRARFLISSTSEVYGDPQVHPQPETYWGNVNPIGPRGVYDEAKRYAEALTMAYHNQQGVDTAIARIFNTYGPKMRRNDGRATVTFLHQAIEGKPITVFGDGSQTRSLCYVDDLIRGLYLLATSDEHLPVNIGNPYHEVTMLQLAESCIRLAGSASEIVFQALPVDDPKERRPDITKASQILGWEPEIDLDEGRPALAAVSRPRARRSLMRTYIAVAAVVLCAALVPGAARPAAQSHSFQVGIYDDAQLRYGPTATTVALYKKLHVQVARMTLYWGGPLGVSRRRPAHPSNPADPSYDWAPYDSIVEQLSSAGIQVVFSIYGTPAWANKGKGQNVAPLDPSALRSFAYAAALRYSGTYVADGKTLPKVRDWLAWNEPNNPVFLKPQYKRDGKKWVMLSAINYAKICNSIYNGVHGSGLTQERVACGATAPRGNNNPGSSRPSVSPLSFLRAVKADGLVTFDAWAHHPYYGKPSETPATPDGVGESVELGNLNTLIRLVTQLYGNKRIWITEYGYETNPPDALFGVSYAKQAAYLKQAFAIARGNPRVDMMLWFLLKDDTNLNGWQSGLISAAGKKKPSFNAFAEMAAGD